MKSFLPVLVVILIALVFWVRHVSVRPTEAHREIIAELKEELRDSEKERVRLVAELVEARAAMKKEPAPSPQDTSGIFSEKAEDSAPALAPAPAQAADLDGRLHQLAEIYHANHGELLKKKAGQESAQDQLKARRVSILERPMNFSELSTVTDSEGNITGTRGVRTSDADRTRAVTKRDDEISTIDEEIHQLAIALAGTEAELKRLDELYRNAVAKAKAELGGR